MGEQVPGEPGLPKKFPWRPVITGVIGLIIIVAIFTLLLPKAASYEEALKELTTIPREWLIALGVACLLNIGLYPLTVLVAVPALRYWHGFIERQSGFLVSNALPGGGAIAVGTQYAILNQYRVAPALAVAAVSADAVWTYLITLGMPAIGVALLVVEGRQNPQLTTMAVIGLVALLVSVVVIILALRSEASARRVGGWGQAVVTPVMRRFHKEPPDVVDAAVNFYETAHDLVARKWLQLTITNVIAQATPFLVLLCALAGLGTFPADLSLIEIFAAYSAAILLTSFPLTPGGLGTVDAALIALLIAFGAPGSEAVAADLMWRLVWFLPQLLVGGVSMLVYLFAKRRNPVTAEPPPTPA